jgi:hypothetical protein
MERQLSDKLKIVEQGDSAKLVYTADDNKQSSIDFRENLIDLTGASMGNVGYLDNVTSDVQTQLDAKINADYVIEKVGSTYYARSSGSYTAYSNTSASVVINSAMGQLTSGGVIFIKGGLYDNMDVLKVPYSNIVLQGVKNLTKWKLKASADVGVGYGLGFINLSNDAIAGSPPVNYITIKDIELDGNGANQTLIDNGAGTTARLSGVYSDSHAITNITITNCYIHDFACFGIILTNASDGIIQDNKFEHNYWNAVTIAGGSKITIDNNYIHGSGDVGIASYGADIVISNNFINGMDGAHGSFNSKWGIAFEGGSTARNKILLNTVTATALGISAAEASTNCEISDNYIHDLVGTFIQGINLTGAVNILVSNNKIYGIDGWGILVGTTTYSNILNNNIHAITTGNAIRIMTGSLYNNINGNNVYCPGGAGILFDSGANYNYIVNNIINGVNADPGNEFSDSGTGNIYINNYLVQSGKWFQGTGAVNNAITATSDGLTTGLISLGSQNITVTSANANNIICLPTAGATTIGMKITGIVTSNGCEMRVIAAQATTVYLNNVTTNVEAAIPANTYFEVICVDATHWILRAWTMLGAPITAIVPDAQ